LRWKSALVPASASVWRLSLGRIRLLLRIPLLVSSGSLAELLRRRSVRLLLLLLLKRLLALGWILLAIHLLLSWGTLTVLLWRVSLRRGSSIASRRGSLLLLSILLRGSLRLLTKLARRSLLLLAELLGWSSALVPGSVWLLWCLARRSLRLSLDGRRTVPLLRPRLAALRGVF
jgi:hypothetical protein